MGKCITPRRIKYLPGSKCNYVPILGIGHPRTGTGFTAVSLQRWGLDVLHENIGKDGIVSWFLTFPYGPYLWQHQFLKRPNYDHLIYNVRNPITSLSSIVYTETPHAIRSGFEKNGEVFVVNTKPIIKHDFISHRFRSAYINGIVRENPIESAIRSICGFNDIIRDLKPFTYRIEDQSKLLYKYLKYDYDHIHWVDDQIPYNTREHSSFEKMLSDFPPVMDVYADMINLYCLEHGYEEIKFK